MGRWTRLGHEKEVVCIVSGGGGYVGRLTRLGHENEVVCIFIGGGVCEEIRVRSRRIRWYVLWVGCVLLEMGVIGRGKGCCDKFVLREVLVSATLWKDCCIVCGTWERGACAGIETGCVVRSLPLSTMRSCVCLRKVYWNGCGNAPTARGGLGTVWSHSSVILKLE